jgi:polyphosphate kinase
LRQQLEQVLDLYLNDTGAWHMDSEGQFHQRQQEGEEQLAQDVFMKRWRGGLVAPNS